MTTDTAAPLTRDDLAALRAADGLTLHHLRPSDDRQSQIRAYLHGYGQRIYTAREQVLFPTTDTTDRSRAIPVESDVSGYGWPADHAGQESDTRAFAMVGMNPILRTIVSLLRTGDELHLLWQADNNNDNHRAVGYHADELRLFVRNRKLTFPVAYSVGPDNSARMIRQHG